VTAQPAEPDEVFLAGYLRGVESGSAYGHAAGYVDGVAVLDDAAAALAKTQPWKSIEVAAARERLRHPATPDRTAEQLRAEAFRSWGLDLPADATASDHLAETTACDDLTDDDDWAWQA
jgi:hypothetical protein